MMRRCLLSGIAVLFTLTSCGQSSGADGAAAAGDSDATDTTDALVVDDQTSASSDSGTPPEHESDGDTSAGSSSSTTELDGDGTRSTTTTSTTATNTTAMSTTATNTTKKATTTAGGGSGDSEQPGRGTADEPDYDPGLQPLVDQARSDLADRLGVGTGQITLVLAELREWPNSAAGCPVDGLEYQQIPTDGSEIIFTVDGSRYRYVTGGTIYTPRLCE